MTSARLTLALLSLLLAGSLSAQQETGIVDASGVRLPPSTEVAERSVYIVQLAAPSAAEQYAKLARQTGSSAKAKDTGAPRFDKNNALVQQHTGKILTEQQKILSAAGSGTRMVYSYTVGLNGFAAEMSKAQAQKLERMDDVLRVWKDEVRPLATTDSLNFLNLFDASGGLRSERGLDGDGLVIGFVDSGVAPEHPALQETREADQPRLCRSSWAESTVLGQWLCRRYDTAPEVLAFDEPEGWNGVCQTGERFEETDCNNKLIGARWYIDGAEATGPIDTGELRSARDVDGHGTHTATTGAGNRTTASIFGTLIGGLEGVAPKARVAVYKACWLRPGSTRASCNTSDLMHAIDEAVADGVDIINYSVGSTMREVTAPDDLALLAAAKAGVLAVVAAGNEGPALATIGSPASAPWVLTAAASTRTGSTFGEGFDIDSPPSIAGRRMIRESAFSPALADRDPIEGSLVLADDGDTSLPGGQPGVASDGCQPLINSSEMSGNIALLQRSGCLFTDMVRNAEDAGAIAALIYNIGGDAVLMTGETGLVDIPALMIGQADGNLILAELDAGNDVTVTLEKSLRFETAADGNLMATFSSRGPGYLGDVIKPDVTAPGVNIVAGFTPDAVNAVAGENFAYLSGTSMSAPHIAGVAALLKQAHPNWSPAALKSSLMTTARQDVALPNTTAPPNPFDFGAGHIDANSAFDPGLIYDIGNDEYDDLLSGDLAADEFNLPSIAVSRLAASETVTRRVTNVDDTAASYTVEISAPPGIGVGVNPASLSLMPGETGSYNVTIDYQSGPLDLWRFGSITWSGDEHEVYSPLAVRPASISAPEQINGVGGMGSTTFSVTFGYDGAYTPRVHGLNLPFLANQNEPFPRPSTTTRPKPLRGAAAAASPNMYVSSAQTPCSRASRCLMRLLTVATTWTCTSTTVARRAQCAKPNRSQKAARRHLRNRSICSAPAPACTAFTCMASRPIR